MEFAEFQRTGIAEHHPTLRNFGMDLPVHAGQMILSVETHTARAAGPQTNANMAALTVTQLKVKCADVASK